MIATTWPRGTFIVMPCSTGRRSYPKDTSVISMAFTARVDAAAVGGADESKGKPGTEGECDCSRMGSGAAMTRGQLELYTSAKGVRGAGGGRLVGVAPFAAGLDRGLALLRSI